MATVESKTSIKIDQLINDTVISGSIDPGSGHLILTTRGGASIDAGAVVKPFGLPWSSTSTYENGDIVGYNGEVWKATGSNTNKPPTLYGSLWTRLTGKDADWVERNPYFSSDLLSESWQLFWKSGTVNSSLDTVAGEFESGIQSLKLDMAASSMQRIYIKEENIVEGGDYVTATVRAKLVSAASGVTVNAELQQNNAAGKPEPFATGLSTTASAEGAQTITTSWQTFTFTCLAANAKPRANMNVYVTTGANAAVVLIDQIRFYRGKGPALSKPVADTLYLPKYQEYDSGWIYLSSAAWGVLPSEVALQNGAGIYGSVFSMPRFRRIGDVVYMEGLVSNPPGSYGVIFTLPVGFRPDGDIIPASFGNAGTENHGVRILANGNVLTGTAVTTWTSIHCQFPVSGGAYTWHVIGAAGEPAFGSGWGNYGGGWQSARYCRIGDYVYLSGLVTRSSGTNNTIFSLPSGYQNTNGSTHTSAPGTGTLLGTDGGVNIGDSAATGNITCRGSGAPGAGGYISLAGIRIYVGANDNKWKKFRAGADGWYGQTGAYGAPWPVPAIRRDGKIIFLEGLANFTVTGNNMKLPLGYAPSQQLIVPVLNTNSKRLDIKSPYGDGVAGSEGAMSIGGTGVLGFTNTWVVADVFEGDIRWNT